VNFVARLTKQQLVNERRDRCGIHCQHVDWTCRYEVRQTTTLNGLNRAGMDVFYQGEQFYFQLPGSMLLPALVTPAVVATSSRSAVHGASVCAGRALSVAPAPPHGSVHASSPFRRLPFASATPPSHTAGDDDTVPLLESRREDSGYSGGGLDAEPFIPERVRIVLLCFAAYVLCNVDRITLSVAILPMAEVYGWSQTTAGIVQSSFFWGYVLTQIPGGYLADKYGGRSVLSFGVLAWSAMTLLTPSAASTSLPVLLAARVVCFSIHLAVFGTPAQSISSRHLTSFTASCVLCMIL
jgi:Major Facilitator Superfamily